MESIQLVLICHLRSLAAQVETSRESDATIKLQKALSGENDQTNLVDKLIKQLLRSEFGVTVTDQLSVQVQDQDTRKDEESAGYKEIKVDLKQGVRKANTDIKIAKGSEESQIAEGPIASVTVENAKTIRDAYRIAHEISKKLAEALSHFKVKAAAKEHGYVTGGGSTKFHDLVDKIKESLVKGTGDNATEIARKLAEELQNANTEVELGSTGSFKELVAVLKPLLSGESLDAERLRGALQAAKNQIQQLLNAEFKVDVPANQIQVNGGVGENKVEVNINKEPEASGTQPVKEGWSSIITPSNSIELHVCLDSAFISADANLIGRRLTESVHIARENGKIKPVQQLVRKDFDLASATVAVEADRDADPKTVTVEITGRDAVSQGQGTATLIMNVIIQI